MKINLLDLAQQTDQLCKKVHCSFGLLKVYHVPDALLLAANLSRVEPEQPIVRIKTVTGHQDRLAKPGDDEYTKWQSELADYNNEMFRLRSAIRMVSALKDIEYPDTSKPPTEMASIVFNGNWPDDKVLQKKAWLDFTVLAKRIDSDAIYRAINEMNGEMEATEDQVNEVKKSLE